MSTVLEMAAKFVMEGRVRYQAGTVWKSERITDSSLTGRTCLPFIQSIAISSKVLSGPVDQQVLPRARWNSFEIRNDWRFPETPPGSTPIQRTASADNLRSTLISSTPSTSRGNQTRREVLCDFLREQFFLCFEASGV